MILVLLHLQFDLPQYDKLMFDDDLNHKVIITMQQTLNYFATVPLEKYIELWRTTTIGSLKVKKI